MQLVSDHLETNLKQINKYINKKNGKEYIYLFIILMSDNVSVHKHVTKVCVCVNGKEAKHDQILNRTGEFL